MERFPVELLYVLGFIAIVLLNYFVQRAARRRQHEEAAAQPAPPAIEDELAEDVWGRTPAPAPAPSRTLVIVPRATPLPVQHAEPPAPRRIHPVRALLKDKRDLRRAVVLNDGAGPLPLGGAARALARFCVASNAAPASRRHDCAARSFRHELLITLSHAMLAAALIAVALAGCGEKPRRVEQKGNESAQLPSGAGDAMRERALLQK